MRLPSLTSAALLAVALTSLAGCGGSSSPYSIGSQDIAITSAVLPQASSGEVVNHVIPIEGGCGGPYVLSLISGQLPPGLSLDNATHSIQGVLLQAGNYNFTIQIDDTGCTPFATTTQQFTWNVPVGAVTIALCNPAIIPSASYSPPNSVPFPGIDGLKTTIYGDFAVFNFTIAGGQPPYTLEIIDDPNDPNDANWGANAMPQGMSIPPFSASFIGAPQQTGGSVPFLITFKVTDSLNGVGFRKLQWKVDTPPIIIGTPVLNDGKCGTSYSQSVQIVDGVPPFEFELVQQPATVTTWQSPLAPVLSPGTITVNQVTGRANNKLTAANYPAQNVAGPYSAIIPEGLFLREALGTFSGTPRRLGNFTFYLHVFSTLVPNEFGQHVWHTYTNNFANSEPPIAPAPAYAFGSLNTWTVEGALLPGPTYSTIPEFERGVPYNPDGGVAGLSMIAVGGVKKDGLTDAPHFSQVSNIDGTLPPPTQEYGGGYDWTINWNPLGLGTVAPTGVTFTAHTGILTVPNPALLVGQGRQVFEFTARDQQLPIANQHAITNRAAFSVGPDKVIITESTASLTATTAVNDFNNHLQTVKVLEPLSTSPGIRGLSDSLDLTASGIPSTAGNPTVPSLASLLTTVDLLRVSVNPTGWWDDTHGLNPSGARPAQHSDMNKSYTYSNQGWQSGSNPLPWNMDASAVDIPAATGVVENKLAGIYVKGGRLYGFESTTHFGVFIIREDGKLYIPAAFAKGAYQGFGDGMVEQLGLKHSLTRVAQLTVSPNGRFAAMKLKTNTNTGQAAFAESASTTKIVLFSLTGETVFGGSVFKIINTGSNGSSVQGIYQYANSLALTDTNLYYLCGNYLSTYASWKEHAIYTYSILGGAAGGALLPSGGATGWFNDGTSISNMMQTPFQRHDNPTQLSQVAGFNGTGSFSLTFTTIAVMDTEMYAFDSWNVLETGTAPMPFRVSKNGTTCAILAGRETGTTGSTVDQMNYQVFTHTSSAGLKALTTVRRHSPQGGSRGYSLSRGPSSYRHWGSYTGPTTGFEISDDATKVAVVVNRQNVGVSPTSSSNWYNYREDIVAWSTTNAWSTSTEYQVTGTETAGTQMFGGTHNWRFGSLVFTADNGGLIFWGGYGTQNNSLSTSYQQARNWTGTYYSFRFSDSQLRSIMPLAAGGGADAVKTYTTSSVVNPTFVAYSGSGGRLRPIGGFISRSRNFLYITTLAPVSATDQAANTLVGINISTLGAGSINGKTNGEGFRLAGLPSRRGFVPGYYYYTYYPLEYRYYAPANVDGMGGQVMAKSSGYVFYGSHYQSNGPSQSTSTTSTFSTGTDHPTYWGDYGGQSGQVEGFSADVGGQVYRMTQTSLTQTDSTAGRVIHHLETSDDGKALAFVYDTGSAQNYNYGSETVGFIQKIGFDPSTGVLLAGKTEWTTTLTSGRAGDAMSIDSTGGKLYVPFGSGDESNKTIHEVRFNSGTNVFTTRSIGAPRRYNVLFSGR